MNMGHTAANVVSTGCSSTGNDLLIWEQQDYSPKHSVQVALCAPQVFTSNTSLGHLYQHILSSLVHKIWVQICHYPEWNPIRPKTHLYYSLLILSICPKNPQSASVPSHLKLPVYIIFTCFLTLCLLWKDHTCLWLIQFKYFMAHQGTGQAFWKT